MTWPILSVIDLAADPGGVAVLLLGSERARSSASWSRSARRSLTFVSEPAAVDAASTSTTAAMQFVESVPGSRASTPYYALGVDGISMPLILLTTFLTPLVVIAGWQSSRSGRRSTSRRS